MSSCVNPNNKEFQEILKRINNPLLAELEYDRQLEKTKQNEPKSISTENTETKRKGDENILSLEGLNVPKSFSILWKEGINSSARRADLWKAENGGYIQSPRTGNTIIDRYILHSAFYKEIEGKSIREIFGREKILEGQLDGMERDRIQQTVLGLRIAQSLYGNRFNRELADRLGMDRIHFINDISKPPMFVKDGLLYVNTNEKMGFLNSILSISSEQDEGEYISLALSEELIHMVSSSITTKEETLAAFKELTEADKLRIKQSYFNTQNVQGKELSPAQYVHEYVRMKIQDRIFNNTTEKVRDKLNAIINAVWNYIKNIVQHYLHLNNIYNKTLDFINNGGQKEEGIEETLGLAATNRDSIYDTLINVAKDIELRDTPNGGKYFINGKEIKRRVSNFLEDLYNRFKSEKRLLKTEYQEAVDSLKAEKGTALHAAKNYAFTRMIGENGFLRDKELDDDDYEEKNPNFDRALYEILKKNLRDRLWSFGKNSRFLSELTIYDPKRDIAGTVDLLIIQEDGKINILDWKLMDLNIDKFSDVPWYKIRAWRLQMTQYKSILENAYNVKPEQFGQTRMIPILATYIGADAKNKIKPILSEVKIGDPDVKNIEEDYLLPVPLKEESTGNEELDDLLESLNSIYEKLTEKKIKTEEEKAEKAIQLNSLFRAIRMLQMRRDALPLVDQAKLLNNAAQGLIDTYNNVFQGKSPSMFSEAQKEEFITNLRALLQSMNEFSNIDTAISMIFKGEEGTEEMIKDLKAVVSDIRENTARLKRVFESFMDEIVAKGEEIEGLLNPEKVIKGWTKSFVTTSGLQMRGMHVFFKKVNKAFAFAGFDTQTENAELEALEKEYSNWAKGKGFNDKNYFDILKKKGENELIDEYKHEFYTELNKKIKEKDTKWIRENIDVTEYKAYLKEKLAEEIERIKNRNRVLTDEEISLWRERDILPKVIQREIEDAKRLYDTSKGDSLGWLNYDRASKFPNKDKWQSDEWKELNQPQNSPAKAFYDYIIRKNNEYAEIGYITNPRTFLPWVAKDVIEKVATGDFRIGEKFLRAITVNEEDVGYGHYDKSTGEIVNTIPRYFTTKFDNEPSNYLFRNMSLYNEAALKYKYLSEIENQVLGLVDIERNKEAIVTSSFGKASTSKITGKIELTKDNTQNTALLNDMIKAIVYGQRYIESETFDQLLFKIGGWGKTINDKLGKKIFPEDLSERQLSLNKSVDTLNKTFQLSTLGLNLLSATSNLFGGNMQSVINAGKYYTKKDYGAAQVEAFVDRFNSTDKKKLAAALNYFLPFTENHNREVTKKLSMHSFTEDSLQDFLMILMRKSDGNVQIANFLAYLNNTIIQDGALVNAREYLRTLPEYEDKYTMSPEARREYENRFEEAVKELIKEKGVMKLSSVNEKGEFIIPGVERHSNSVVELRRIVQSLNADALGNLTEDNLRRINLQVYGKSFMVFKNWIPRLVDVRMGNIKYNSATDAYEWGRVRTVFRVLSEDFIHSLGNLKNSIIANEKGVEFMRALYEKKKEDYKKDTGKDLKMTESEFIDLTRNNIKNQIVDVMCLAILISLVAGLKAIPPDDEESDEVKNQYRFLVRMLDKFKDELTYFYDPRSLTGIISKGIFPSLTLLENVEKAMTNWMKYNWGIIIGKEDEDMKNVHYIKYLMKTFPFTNQMIGYLPLFYPQLAKDLGIRVQSNYNIVK